MLRNSTERRNSGSDIHRTCNSLLSRAPVCNSGVGTPVFTVEEEKLFFSTLVSDSV